MEYEGGRKRARVDASFNGNGSFKKSKPGYSSFFFLFLCSIEIDIYLYFHELALSFDLSRLVFVLLHCIFFDKFNIFFVWWHM